MDSQTLTDITRAIQLSVAPAFLLVALGTLITILNTRLGRIIDRRRQLQDSATAWTEARVTAVNQELAVLNQRRKLVYLAILSAVSGALLVCLVVASTFLGALLAVELAQLVASLFVLTMGALIAALSLFLREVYIAVDKCRDSGPLRVAWGSENESPPARLPNRGDRSPTPTTIRRHPQRDEAPANETIRWRRLRGGEHGVCYEECTFGHRPGWSILFESGRHDGFSPDEVERRLGDHRHLPRGGRRCVPARHAPEERFQPGPLRPGVSARTASDGA